MSELVAPAYRERTAAVCFHLLTAGGDRAERAALLRRCLNCWTPAGAAPASSGGGGRVLVVTRPARGAAAVGDEALGWLAAALALPPARSVGWVFDVAAEAGLGDGFAARLCERILFPSAAPPGAAGEKGGEGEEEGALPWATEKEVLVRFVRALTGEPTARQDAADEAVTALIRGGRRGPRRTLKRPHWISYPAFVAAAAAATALADGAHPLARCSRALPLLLLLPEK